MKILRLLGLLALPALTACAEAPFVDSTAAELKAGRVIVCSAARHSTPQEVEAVAREACAERKQVPRKISETGFACRLSTPRQTEFQCVPQ